MDAFAPGIVFYQENVKVGKYFGGTMHNNQFFPMFVGSWRKHHGDILAMDCKFDCKFL